MAIGDKAAARGWRLCPGTAAARDIDDEINRVLDILADATATVTSILNGGTGADNPAGARQNLGVIAANVPNKSGGTVQGDLDYIGTQLGDIFRKGETYSRGLIDGAFSSRDASIGDASNRATAALQGNLYGDSYNRNITGTRRAAWLQDNGQLGYASSSERYKKFIRDEDVSDETVLMLSLVSFQWKAAVATDDRREMGLIAERLVEAGLGWACFYDADGRPEGINYETIGLALLPAVQRLIAGRYRYEEELDTAAQRIADLERRIDLIEGSTK